MSEFTDLDIVTGNAGGSVGLPFTVQQLKVHGRAHVAGENASGDHQPYDESIELHGVLKTPNGDIGEQRTPISIISTVDYKMA